LELEPQIGFLAHCLGLLVIKLANLCNERVQLYRLLRVWAYANATHNYSLWPLPVFFTLGCFGFGFVFLWFSLLYLFLFSFSLQCLLSLPSECVLICEMQMKVKVNLLDFHVEIQASESAGKNCVSVMSYFCGYG